MSILPEKEAKGYASASKCFLSGQLRNPESSVEVYMTIKLVTIRIY